MKYKKTLGRSYLYAAGWAACLTGHTEYTIRLSYRVRLVASVFVPFITAWLYYFILSCTCLPRIQKPFKYVYRTDIHAHPICNAVLPVNSYACTMNSQSCGIRLTICVKPDFSLCPYLMPLMFSCDRVFIWLLKKLGVDRMGLITNISNQDTITLVGAILIGIKILCEYRLDFLILLF